MKASNITGNKLYLTWEKLQNFYTYLTPSPLEVQATSTWQIRSAKLWFSMIASIHHLSKDEDKIDEGHGEQTKLNTPKGRTLHTLALRLISRQIKTSRHTKYWWQHGKEYDSTYLVTAPIDLPQRPIRDTCLLLLKYVTTTLRSSLFHHWNHSSKYFRFRTSINRNHYVQLTDKYLMPTKADIISIRQAWTRKIKSKNSNIWWKKYDSSLISICSTSTE